MRWCRAQEERHPSRSEAGHREHIVLKLTICGHVTGYGQSFSRRTGDTMSLFAWIVPGLIAGFIGSKIGDADIFKVFRLNPITSGPHPPNIGLRPAIPKVGRAS